MKETSVSIFDNKIPYKRKFKLELTVTPGHMFGNKWVACKNPAFDYSSLHVVVSYDSYELIKQNLDTDVIDITQLLSDDAGQHQLTITLAGKTDDHTQLINGADATVLMHIKLRIEDLDLNLALGEKPIYQTDAGDMLSWAEFMGINGTQTIPIRTPIYPWLFEHEKELISQFVQNSCKNQ